MNTKGLVPIFALMLGVLLFILGMAIAPALKDTTNEAMQSSFLDCSNSSITDQNKAVCASIDTMQPVFIGVIFGLAGLLIGRLA